MEQRSAIREACARLRRLPEPQWGQPPREPLGARSPHVAPDSDGRTVEEVVRELAAAMQQTDAELRGVPAFTISVQRLALPDVIETLAKSLEATSDARAEAMLERAERALKIY